VSQYTFELVLKADNSPVFRSMIALAKSSSQRDPIHLTDTTFEREEIIERALDMIYTLDFDYDSDDHDLELVLCVIEFAKKWEISLITDIIRKDLERVINSKDGPIYHFDSFLIALKLDNHKLAASYVKMAGKDGWFDAKTDDGNDLEDWGPFNFTTEHFLSDTPKAALSQNHPLLDIAIDKKSILGQIPHDHFLCIPPTVVWVILRAQGLEGKTKLSYRAIVRQLLDLACKYLTSFLH
jgi:hypothetical protein